MTMNAYDKTYLDDAMTNLAVMLDYGTMTDGDSVRFFDRFLVSGIAFQFGKGNPKFISGMSGIELAQLVIKRTGGIPAETEYIADRRSDTYWAGWVLAYLQWYCDKPFQQLIAGGLTIRRILSMYPTYHEADISKFVATSISILSEYTSENPLKRQRKLAGMTQHELSEKTGVKLRMIQAYEQNYQDPENPAFGK